MKSETVMIRIDKFAHSQLKEISEARIEKNHLVRTKKGILSDLIGKAHKREVKQ